MAYLVKLTIRARRDLAFLYLAIKGDHSEAANEWYRAFKQAILSLERNPNRCPKTPENSGLRHLLYGGKPHVYRAIYRVVEREKQVQVLHIRHGARQPFKRSEIA